MAISLLDINPGDTIQGMVEKINYNFDQLQANGGGPQGIQGEQGEQGLRGPRGFQGDQGVRGNMWFIKTNGTSPIPDETPMDNDLSFDGNAEVYIFNGGIWEDTNFNIASALESPFAAFDNFSIGVRNNYENRHLVLGATEDLDNIDTKPSLVICSSMASDADAHADGIEFYYREDSIGGLDPSKRFGGLGIKMDSFSNKELTLESVSTLKITANTNQSVKTSLVLEGSNKTLKWTGFNGVTTDSNVFPLLLTNKEGKIMTGALDGNNNYTYDWFVSKTTNGGETYNVLAPTMSNSTNRSTLGSGDNPIGGIFIGQTNTGQNVDNSGSIVGVGDGTTKYSFNACTLTGIAGALFGEPFGFLGVHDKGITVGQLTQPSNDGLNTMRCGIALIDKITAGPALTLMGRGTKTDYFSSSMSGKAFNISSDTCSAVCEGTVATNQSYSNDIMRGSQYGSNPLIALKANGTDKLSNQLSIKGGKGGHSVSISGGRSYNKKRGGDVYISGGDVIVADPEEQQTTTQLKYQPLYFGDVVIGVNPDNHKDYYTTSTGVDGNSNRGVNDPKNATTPLDFYDINNFTAHANNIWLDSDAQSRIFRRDYYINELAAYPSVNKKEYLTLNMGGLCTLHHGNPIILKDDEMYNYQMVSGKMAYIVRKRWNPSTQKIDTKVFPFVININDDPFANGDVYALVTTDWVKVGNMVQCHTRINFYFYTPVSTTGINLHALYNGYNYSGLYNGNNVVNKRNTSGLIPNILLPVIPKSGDNIRWCGSVIGSGTVYAEKNGSSNQGGFLNGTKTVIFSGIDNNDSNTFSNRRHDANGKITRQGVFNVFSADVLYDECTSNYNNLYTENDLLVDGFPYIVPNCLLSNGSMDKMIEFREFFTMGEFNYSYMLNSFFLKGTSNPNGHEPFRQNWYDFQLRLELQFAQQIATQGSWNVNLGTILGNG